MLPLMLEEGYRPNGWLGMLLGVRLWYQFYGSVLATDEAFDAKIVELCRELGARGKPSAVQLLQLAPPETRSLPLSSPSIQEGSCLPAPAGSSSSSTAAVATSERQPQRSTPSRPVAGPPQTPCWANTTPHSSTPAPGSPAPLSEAFYMQLEREKAAHERAERAADRAAERERAAERFALTALACATVATVACAVLLVRARQ
jgi:hypothetical protein